MAQARGPQSHDIFLRLGGRGTQRARRAPPLALRNMERRLSIVAALTLLGLALLRTSDKPPPPIVHVHAARTYIDLATPITGAAPPLAAASSPPPPPPPQLASAETAPPPQPTESNAAKSKCPPGCMLYGNCDELSGSCECPFTHHGPACNVPRMPSCELADGEPINLSFLVSEQAWQRLRDVANTGRDVRRIQPPFRWLGPLPCTCVTEAIRALSLEASPMPAEWPAFIEHPFLSMQRVVCVETQRTVRELWAAGGASAVGGGAVPSAVPSASAAGSDGNQASVNGRASDELAWAYIPVFAFLKMFPAHSPQLLPPGLVHEADYMAPPGRYSIDLNLSSLGALHSPLVPIRWAPSDALPNMTPNMAPIRQSWREMEPMLGAMLGATKPPVLLPSARCGGCSGFGWCDGSRDSSVPDTTPRCRCASLLGSDGSRGNALLFDPRARVGGNTARASILGTRASVLGTRASVPAVGRSCSVLGSTLGDRRRRHSSGGFGIHDVVSALGPDFWRRSAGEASSSAVAGCPNACTSHGRSCSYGFCHCEEGYWGLDCSLSLERVASLEARRATVRPRIHVYPLPPALRRSCNFWHLAEDVSDRLLRSAHFEPRASHADLFWIYGCPNGDTILPALRWVRQHAPYWNMSVGAGLPRHAIVVPHEEGWAEVWRYLVHWLRGPLGDHANTRGTWDTLHPASATRQMVLLQLSGRSDYPAAGQKTPIRCVSSGAPCYVCFQPRKDVMIPGHPGLIDYPDGPTCRSIRAKGAFAPDGMPRARVLEPRVLFGGAVWTVPQGPGFYEPSRLVLYLCHKNASRHESIAITQTETQPEAVQPWEVRGALFRRPIST